MDSLYNYYLDELSKVSGRVPEFSRQIQVRDNGRQTKWLSLNDDSATELVKWLKEHYNVKEA